MARILITDPIAEEGVALLKQAGHEVVVQPEWKGDLLKEHIGAYEVLIVRSATRVTTDILRAGKRLRIVGRAGVGLDNIDVDTARKLGIQVVNTPGATTIAVAELTVAMILACLRHLCAAHASMQQGRWDKKAFKGAELYGKTVGIIGCGRIGQAVAQRLQAFGCRILGYDPLVQEAPGIHMVPLETLLRESQIVTLHVPLTDETRHLLRRETLSLLPRGAIVVNTARGGVIKEEDLLEFLETDHVACAALDVYEAEPLPPDHPLRRSPKVLLTPHIGAQTREGQVRAAVDLARKIVDLLKS